LRTLVPRCSALIYINHVMPGGSSPVKDKINHVERMLTEDSYTPTRNYHDLW